MERLRVAEARAADRAREGDVQLHGHVSAVARTGDSDVHACRDGEVVCTVPCALRLKRRKGRRNGTLHDYELLRVLLDRRYQDCVGVFGAGLKLRRHSPPTSRSEESAWRSAAPSKPPTGGGVGGGSDAAAAAAAAVTVSACCDAAIVQAALAPCSTAARTWGWGSAFG